MVFLNYSTMEMVAKIVYYGPGLGGKTTNLKTIHEKTAPQSRGKMVSLPTESDRTLFFDLLPMEVGVVGGFRTKLQLYTVPGQVFYNNTRKLVLRGVDGIVFVADSQLPMMSTNLESFQNMEENLTELNLSLEDIPIVLQYNKRDLPNVLSVSDLNENLNKLKLSAIEASAVNGFGVIETLREISKQTLHALNRKSSQDAKPETPKPEPGELDSGPIPEDVSFEDSPDPEPPKSDLDSLDLTMDKVEANLSDDDHFLEEDSRDLGSIGSAEEYSLDYSRGEETKQDEPPIRDLGNELDERYSPTQEPASFDIDTSVNEPIECIDPFPDSTDQKPQVFTNSDDSSSQGIVAEGDGPDDNDQPLADKVPAETVQVVNLQVCDSEASFDADRTQKCEIVFGQETPGSGQTHAVIPAALEQEMPWEEEPDWDAELDRSPLGIPTKNTSLQSDQTTAADLKEEPPMAPLATSPAATPPSEAATNVPEALPRKQTKKAGTNSSLDELNRMTTAVQTLKLSSRKKKPNLDSLLTDVLGKSTEKKRKAEHFEVKLPSDFASAQLNCIFVDDNDNVVHSELLKVKLHNLAQGKYQLRLIMDVEIEA